MDLCKILKKKVHGNFLGVNRWLHYYWSEISGDYHTILPHYHDYHNRLMKIFRFKSQQITTMDHDISMTYTQVQALHGNKTNKLLWFTSTFHRVLSCLKKWQAHIEVIFNHYGKSPTIRRSSIDLQNG